MSTELMLPKHVDPVRFSLDNKHLEGILPLLPMSRLALHTGCAQEAHASIELIFSMSGQGIPLLTGNLKTNLMLICQRCAKPFIYEIITDLMLGIVKTSEEEKRLPENYEMAWIDGRYVVLSDLIEDELILRVPMIPKHPSTMCNV